MSCSAALYTANTTAQTVAVDGTVALGSIVRRYGCGLALSGNVISITNPGYYDVDISVTAVLQPQALSQCRCFRTVWPFRALRHLKLLLPLQTA